MRRLIRTGLLTLVFLTYQGVVLGASEVADAVMQGDAARLQTLLKSHEDVNAPHAGRQHGPALGRLSR
jgi:hypothetical protein